MRSIPQDIDIARSAPVRPISHVAERLGIPQASLYQYGPSKAKVAFDFIDTLAAKPSGKLILVTAISPTAKARPRSASA